jgi:pyruvate dehydrogenase E1 component alpha subunit
MNMAAVMKLPIVWVCHNNLYAQFMPLRDAFPSEDITSLAAPYRMPAESVDGQDVVAVHEAVQRAVARARAGDGPSLVECKTYRYRAHAEGVPDISHYEPRPESEIAAWKKRDPVVLFGQRLLEDGVLTKGDLDRIEAEAMSEMDAAERFAVDSPSPDAANLEHMLYSD